MKEVKIIKSPFSPGIEVVDPFTMMVIAPFSETLVTVKIDTNIQDYKEKDDQPGMQVRQSMVTSNTAHTKTLNFNLTNNKVHKIEVDGRKFAITLLEIGREEFLYFKFRVEEE